MNQALVQKVTSELEQLPDEMFSNILTFVTSLQYHQGGVPGKKLLKFAGILNSEDADDMLRAIEHDCRKIDHAEW